MTTHLLDNARPVMAQGIELDREHRKRIARYVISARHAAGNLIQIVAFESAVRSFGLCIRSPLCAGQFRLPMAAGLAITLDTEADTLAAAITQAKANLFTPPV